MGKSAKDSCCEKYRRKAKACKGCPLMAALSAKERERKLKKAKKRLARVG